MGACGVTPPLPGLRRLLDPELCLEVRGREPAGAEGEPPTAGPRVRLPPSGKGLMSEILELQRPVPHPCLPGEAASRHTLGPCFCLTAQGLDTHRALPSLRGWQWGRGSPACAVITPSQRGSSAGPPLGPGLSGSDPCTLPWEQEAEPGGDRV